MKYTIIIEPLHNEYNELQWIARFDANDGERLTGGHLKKDVIGIGETELDAVYYLILETKDAL